MEPVYVQGNMVLAAGPGCLTSATATCRAGHRPITPSTYPHKALHCHIDKAEICGEMRDVNMLFDGEAPNNWYVGTASCLEDPLPSGPAARSHGPLLTGKWWNKEKPQGSSITIGAACVFHALPVLP